MKIKSFYNSVTGLRLNFKTLIKFIDNKWIYILQENMVSEHRSFEIFIFLILYYYVNISDLSYDISFLFTEFFIFFLRRYFFFIKMGCIFLHSMFYVSRHIRNGLFFLMNRFRIFAILINFCRIMFFSKARTEWLGILQNVRKINHVLIRWTNSSMK